ncbi:MAG TPA: hypothetical protein VI456_09630 [Polyangia bacterium]
MQARQIEDDQIPALLRENSLFLETTQVLVDALPRHTHPPRQVLLRELVTDPDPRRSELLSVQRQQPQQALGEPRRQRKAGQIVGPGGQPTKARRQHRQQRDGDSRPVFNQRHERTAIDPEQIRVGESGDGR